MHLRDAIKTKLSKKIFLLHDNAGAHKTALIQKLLTDFQWDIFPHAVRPCAIYFILYYFQKLDATFYGFGISKLM